VELPIDGAREDGVLLARDTEDGIRTVQFSGCGHSGGGSFALDLTPHGGELSREDTEGGIKSLQFPGRERNSGAAKGFGWGHVAPGRRYTVLFTSFVCREGV
jgi:hypothetical protein